MPPEVPPGDMLLKAIAKQQKALEHTISARRRDKREVTPEHQRVLGEIHEALGELHRLHLLKQGARASDAAALERSLIETVGEREVTSLSIPAAWEYALGLRRLLLTVGDRNYIKAQLESEWRKETGPVEPYDGRWSAFFDAKLLADLRAEYERPGAVAEDDDAHRQAVEYLTYLSLTRNGKGRVLAMNSNTRRLYLDRLTAVMAGLLLLLLVIIYIASDNANYSFLDVLQEIGKDGPANFSQFRLNFGSEAFHHAIIAAVLGATGSLLSGFYTLRDKSKHLNDLRAFRSAMWAQPFVGAIAGIVVFLIVKSGIIGLTVREGVQQWPAYALYGFLAGYSEPFFLGLVSRVASTADKDSAAGTAPPPQPPPASGANPRNVTSPDISSPDISSPHFNSPDVTSPPGVKSPPEDEGFTSP